eukprot:jgi/Tetstr1/442152/TSEL_030304.t1
MATSDVRELASLAGRAQFLLLAIELARLILRGLHDVPRTKDSWSGRIKMTHPLRYDLEWWVAVHGHSNGSCIYKPVETAYMHVDSSGYGWGAVLSETTGTGASGFWYDGTREMHITYNKEFKAVRYAVLIFLSGLRGRQVLLHGDNMGVVHILANLTLRSPLLNHDRATKTMVLP